VTKSENIFIGCFVRVKRAPLADLGIGKVTQIGEGFVRVQYFDTPGAVTPEPYQVPRSDVGRIRIPSQSRVYRRTSGGRWQVGRVLEDDDSIIFVQFPNGETVNVDTVELQVRWSRPLTDPLPLLVAEATETPFLADARANFLHAVARQHHAAAGVSAVLCSSIDLVDYQFDIVRQVLTDPVQRYLLADEVGLGKTIEASIIVRQYFIDDPNARAVLIVPTALLYQWRQELATRFGLINHLDDSLHVISHDDIEKLSRVIASAGMLVVDEAHHLSRQSTGSERELYALLESHAKRVPRLLLLSATPVLGNAEEFLRVLHLLDPVVFPLEDLEGFKRRIDSRQVVAEVVSTLIPENVWGMGPDLDRLLENYPDDSLLVAKLAGLKQILDTFPDEDNEQFLIALDDLKTHLIESYRLHRRILRNRRAEVSWATPRRSEMRSVNFSSHSTLSWRERLEDLRLTAMTTGDLPAQLEFALLQTAVNPMGSPSLRLTMGSVGLNNQNLMNLADALDQATVRLREDPKRLDALTQLVLRQLDTKGAQIVVFCDRPEDAERVMHALTQEVGNQVVRHEPVEITEDGEFTTPPWQQFLSTPDRVRVLICDRRAEEGVNLHGGRKIAIHYDLPASPNRIEQRLGRLDRYGTGDPIVSYVLLDEENSDEVAWACVLNEGWGLFKQSVASLQYLIEATAGPLAREWVELGTVALQNQAQQLGGENGQVQNEVRQLNHQDSLDAMANREIAGMEDLEDEDSEWVEWRAAFKSLAIEALQFHWRSEGETGTTSTDTPFRVGYSHRDGGKTTLLPLTGFLKHFLATVDQTATGSNSRMPLTHRYAFKRQTTTNRRGLAQGVRLLRIGDPLVTSLEQFCANDDRGRAFAVWRVDRQYDVNDPSGADLYFRFDFLVRAALTLDSIAKEEELDDPSKRIYAQAISRKASTFLPPLAIRVWVRGNGEIEPNPTDLLTSEYSDRWKGSRRDFNLNVSRWRSLPADIKSTWMRDWVSLCERQREKAIESVKALPEYQKHLDLALQACHREQRLRRSQGEARVSRLFGAAQEQELADLRQAEAMYAALEDAIRHPRLELDVVGAVFLASDSNFNE
jgi:ATP-dependent helicase HepA